VFSYLYFLFEIFHFRYYSREDAEDAVKYISGTTLDDRPIRADFDWGFEEGRQWGRGRSGGQVRDEYRTDYDPGRGGYGKMVQKELEQQRQLVDYGGGSLNAFQPSHCESILLLYCARHFIELWKLIIDGNR
jgi:hypothetical protein